MTQTDWEVELKQRITEFAASDESLQEMLVRLEELDSIIKTHQMDRATLDETGKALRQVTLAISKYTEESLSVVRNISKVSSEFGQVLVSLTDNVNGKIEESLNASKNQISSIHRSLESFQTEFQLISKTSTRRHNKTLLLIGISCLITITTVFFH